MDMTELQSDKFKLIGGAAALDFVNTVSARVDGPGKPTEADPAKAFRTEKFGEYSDLLAWSKKSGLFDENEIESLIKIAEREPRAAASVLKKAVHLREVVYRLFKAACEGWLPDENDLRNFNEHLRRAKAQEHLVHDKNGFSLETGSRELSLDKVLWLLANAAAELLASGELSRVRQCHGKDCGWLFIDTSRSRNRQ